MVPITALSHLANPLVTSEQLETSATQLDGVPKDLEDSIRFETARLMQAAGILLRLPQDLIAQSIVILYRFWTGPEGGSMLDHDSKVSRCQIILCDSNTDADTNLGCRCCCHISNGKTIWNTCLASPNTACIQILEQPWISSPGSSQWQGWVPTYLEPLRRRLRKGEKQTVLNRISHTESDWLRNSCCPSIHSLYQLCANLGRFQFRRRRPSRQTSVCSPQHSTT